MQSVVGVSVQEAGGALQFGAPRHFVSQWTILTIPFFSVSPDGKRFLMERVSQQVNQPITANHQLHGSSEEVGCEMWLSLLGVAVSSEP